MGSDGVLVKKIVHIGVNRTQTVCLLLTSAVNGRGGQGAELGAQQCPQDLLSS